MLLMAVGLQNNLKIGAIIQARMASTRLPGKILMPLPFPGGKPLLTSLIDGIRRSLFVNKIILATSVGSENDILANFSRQNGIFLYRGSEENVLSRFVDVIRQYHLDIVVRLTGDNPIVDAQILDRAIKYHVDEGNDYTKTSLLPVGMNFEIASAESIVKQLEYPLTKADKEHVTLFIRNSTYFKKGDFLLSEYQEVSSLRLTIDYPSDFAMLSLLFSMIPNDGILDITLLRKLKDTHGWLFDINASNIQRRQYGSEEEEIQFSMSLLEAAGMERAARILKEYGVA